MSRAYDICALTFIISVQVGCVCEELELNTTTTLNSLSANRPSADLSADLFSFVVQSRALGLNYK